jgi:spermidine synthase
VRLFLVSLLLLFLELACIRWFSAHVVFLTFFTNIVLLASFLGMSVGCLAANHRRDYLAWTPALLAVPVLAAVAVDYRGADLAKVIDVGNQASPQLVFFGTEHPNLDLARFILPVEVLAGFFFLAIACAFIGPGQELGRALKLLPNRVAAYTLNILGSIAGIALFAACSWWKAPPFWWFLPVVLGLGWLLFRRPLTPALAVRWGLLALVLAGACTTSIRAWWRGREGVQTLWSPYYRIDYTPSSRELAVNLISHQGMQSLEEKHVAYALPHLLNRDSDGPPFRDVLIIGAGSGNDVSRALQWGAEHVDAVEIDPTIQRLGEKHHPSHPYQDRRVTVHLDDGRNFLRATDRKYDLVVYALVDSLVLHSSYSNIRLESYLFTQQALQDVRRHLKPNGLFVMYNFFRQGWIVARLQKGLSDVFQAEPLVLTLPSRPVVQPEGSLWGYFTVFFAGNTERLANAFQQGSYWVARERTPNPTLPNGFANPGPEERSRWQQASPVERERGPWLEVRLAEVVQPAESLRQATDDWPFLYLRRPMVPDLSLRGVAIMGGLSCLLLLGFLPRSGGGSERGRPARTSLGLSGRMFFLGAGFMLVETKAVVHMALLFGSTWMVNSVVFFAVLVMILVANLFTLFFRPRRLGPYYLGLLAALALNCLVPLDFFLGMSRALQVAGASLLVFAPILFAGVIFAASFQQSTAPDRDMGANIAGAMFGGLAETTSMLLGFQYLVLVAMAFYALSAVLGGRGAGTEPLPTDEDPLTAVGAPVQEEYAVALGGLGVGVQDAKSHSAFLTRSSDRLQ